MGTGRRRRSPAWSDYSHEVMCPNRAFAGVFSVLLVFCGNAQAQERLYPSRAIRLIVPFAPGGTTDILGRRIAEALGKRLGQPMVVENKSGAGGALGSLEVATAAPDGYTLGMATFSTHIVIPACSRHVRYDPIKDFSAIGLVAETPVVLVGRTPLASEVSTFHGLVASRGEYSYGTPGNCSFGHLLLERIRQTSSVRFTHVPYRGSALMAADLVGGNLDFVSDTLTVLGPALSSGKVHPLAVTGPRRIDSLREVPTFSELGYPDLSMTLWYGLVAPAGLPSTVANVLERELGAVVSDAAFQSRLESEGIFLSRERGAEAFKSFISRRFPQERAFMRSRGMTSD